MIEKILKKLGYISTKEHQERMDELRKTKAVPLYENKNCHPNMIFLMKSEGEKLKSVPGETFHKAYESY